MEIVLQWLDDLDDVVFAGLLAWERLRRRFLQIGLTSTLGLAACVLAATALEWIPVLAAVAASSVAAALLGAAFASLADPSEELGPRA